MLSALGLVISERRRDLARSVLFRGTGPTAEAVAAVMAELAATGREELGAAAAEIRCSYDLRYRGQAFELTVDGAASPIWASCAGLRGLHAERYGYSDPDAELELVTVRVAVAEPGGAEPDGRQGPRSRGRRAGPVRGRRDRGRGHAGRAERVPGPAICELAGPPW